MNTDIQKTLEQYGPVLVNEPLKNHTTFEIGGPCDYLIEPTSYENVQGVLKFVREEGIPYMILGNGSNLLVRDGGIRGVVIKICDNLSDIVVNGHRVTAQAGAMNHRIAKETVKHDLQGFAFASGIPGTVGGAMVMNAGAYGGEMKDITENVRIIDENNEIRLIPAEEMEFAYRHSAVIPNGWVVLETTFLLREGDHDTIVAEIEDLKQRREDKQPLEWASAGSTFKRPEGYFAGKLIDDSGLRGFQYHDAQVSEKHCGFVINRGNATADDVLTLIQTVQKIVKDEQGVDLETEVKIIGEEPCK